MTNQPDAPRGSRAVVPPEPIPGTDPNELALKEQAAIAEGRLRRYKRDESIVGTVTMRGWGSSGLLCWPACGGNHLALAFAGARVDPLP